MDCWLTLQQRLRALIKCITDVISYPIAEVLAYMCTQPILAYDKDMAVDQRRVDLFDWRHPGPPTLWLLQVGTKQDHTVGDVEVVVDEMNTKNLVCIMPNK